jgi:hypothetical protein
MTYLCSVGVSQEQRVNLNTATKLRDVAFICWVLPGWILATLRTVTRNHRELKQITLTLLYSHDLSFFEHPEHVIGEIVYGKWLEFDRFLTQLCESQSIRLKVLYDKHDNAVGSRQEKLMKVLLPGMMARGMVDLAGEYRE